MKKIQILIYFILSYYALGQTNYFYNGNITATSFFGNGSNLTGVGDVDGPGSSVDSRVTAFDGTTGKLLKDSGLLVSNVPSKATTNTFTQPQTTSVADLLAGTWRRSDGAADGTGQELRLLLGTGGGATSGTLLGHYALSGGVSTAKNFFRMYDTGFRFDDAASNPMLDVNFSTDTVGIGASSGSEQSFGKLYIGGTYNTSATNNVRGILVNPTVTLGETFAIAGYDVSLTTLGVNNNDHIAGFQSRAIHDSNGTLNNHTGFVSIPVNNGGINTNVNHFYAYDATGTGSVTNQYGLYVSQLSKATNNWAVYTAGTTQSRFGGNISATAFTGLNAQAGTDSNTAGGNTLLSAGNGTGTANGGNVYINTSIPTTSGTSAGTLTPREFYFGGEKNMTESTATTLVNISFGSGKYIGGSIVATTQAGDGTDIQATTQHFTFSAVNKSGTVTASIQASPSTSSTAASTGTLTSTWTIVPNGASVDIKNNAVSSLTQTSLKVSYKITLNGDATTTITP